MKSLTLSMLAVLLACNFAEAQTYAVADSLFTIATQAEEAGDWATAAEYYEKSVVSEKACEEQREKELFEIISKASKAYYQLNNLEKALEYGKESYELAKHLFEDSSEQIGAASQALGNLYEQMGHYSDALPLYLIWLETIEQTVGKVHSTYGSGLESLAGLYDSMGEYDDALALYLEALEIIEKTLGKENSQYGSCLSNLALVYESLGQLDRAFELYQEALQNIEKSLGKSDGEYGVISNNLALLLYTMGQYDAALPLFMVALEITEQTLGKDHFQYGIQLNNLANLYNEWGRYDKALPLYFEALENTEKALGKGHPYYASRLGNLAQLYTRMGQYDKALPLSIAALENTENAVGRDHPQYGIRLHNLALVYHEIGDTDMALPLATEALQNIENSLGKEHWYYGAFLTSLSSLYKTMGQFDKALTLQIEATENTEKLLGKEHLSYGRSLSSLASTYQMMSEYEKALQLYLEALEITEKSVGKEHSLYGPRLNDLGLIYEGMEQYDRALVYYLEGMKHGFSQIEQAFALLSEKEKEQFLRNRSRWFDIYRNFFFLYSNQMPEVSAYAYDIDLVLKGMILSSGEYMREAIRYSSDSTALAVYDRWEIERKLLAQEYSKPIAERRDDIAELEVQAEKTEAELTRMSGAFKEASALGSVRWTDVQASLKADEVAIEFASFRYHTKSSWTDSVLYVANVLRKTDAHPHMVYLCEQAQLDSIFELAEVSNSQFVSSLYRGASPVKGLASDQTKGARLYKLIWAPLEAYLTPGSTVHYAPSGTLHQVAFAALPTGGDSLLMDRHALVQLSSTAQLIRQGDEKQGAPASMALFGGISYELEQEDLLASAATFQSDQYTSRSLPDDLVRGDNWNYLPGTLKEVEAIRDIAEKRAVQTTLFTGTSAVEESFKSLGGAQSPEVLHISTHGFFFPDPQREQSDAFSESKTVFRASDNPLLRSGLLFAGANRAWRGEALPEGVDDGILTAYEVSHLYLGNTRLVVLSACETGLGDIKGSEGVFGLQRAFKAAGADYLMMSLWKVPDAETAQFMAHFYKSWFAGADIATAFHDTQQAMRLLYPNDPYKWAAFVLVR